MVGIRAFTRDDLAPVTDLYSRVFWGRPAPEALRGYFEQIYFGNPWIDPELPSYLYEDEGGQIVGFMGMVARPMVYRGRPIRMAVCSGLVVDPGARRRMIGPQLALRVLAGPQDLTLTDGANRESRMLWRGIAGEVAWLHSCHWIRVLRPGAYFLQLARSRKTLRPVATVLGPGAALADALAVRAPLGPYRLPKADPGAVGAGASPEELLEYIAEFNGRCALTPIYEPAGFAWLLKAAAEAERRGRLEAVVVKDAGGKRLGWYIYFAKRGGVAEVLQLGGAPPTIRRVLDHLFRRAWECGAVALRGQLDPRFIIELAEARCAFSFQDVGVLIHSRDPLVTRAIHAGDTSLSRLDGEWWMHFQDGPWA